MQNTLYTGDRLLMLNSLFCTYEQGDIVVINAYNSDLDDTIIKRIIAVGGKNTTVDIDFEQGIVYVDGEPLDEPYIKELTYTTDGTQFPVTLKEDEVFVMGDNRSVSMDSRLEEIGSIPRNRVIGKVVLSLG